MLLKVLLSEMEPAEIRFIRNAFIKEKSARPPSWECHLMIPRHLVYISFRIANWAHRSVCGLLYITYSCQQRRYEQICKLLPMAQWTFLSPKSFYSLQATALWTLHSNGNGTMNSFAILAKVQWTPLWYWQQCNELLCDDACRYVETSVK